MADSDIGKLFVGGISRDTTDAILRDYFSKYGVVSSSSIAKDRLTGVPRGFGFVTFSDPSSVDIALRDHHIISSRTVEVKKALPRFEQQQSNSQQQQLPQRQQQSSQVYSPYVSKGFVRNTNDIGYYGASNTDQTFKTKKIFVGGLSANLTEEEFKNYFEKFGKTTDAVVMRDHINNRPRGFGFITFESEEVVENLMQKSYHELGGKRVEVKRAVPKEAARISSNGTKSRNGDGSFSPVVAGGYPGQFTLPAPYSGYYGGIYGGGYPVGGYGSIYGVPVPRIPWNSFGMMAVQPITYGTGFYPTGNGDDGGVAMLGMFNGYNAVVDNRVHVKSQDVNGNMQFPAKGVVNVNARKNSRISDVQVQAKASLVSQSS